VEGPKNEIFYRMTDVGLKALRAPVPTRQPSKAKGKWDTMFVAALIVLAGLYFWDKDYNNGKILDGLDDMRRDISQHMFHWSPDLRAPADDGGKWSEDGDGGKQQRIVDGS
jgi:hypothetical protein